MLSRSRYNFARFGRFGRFGGFVSLVSFRPFRFVVSGFSTCPFMHLVNERVSFEGRKFLSFRVVNE